MDNWQSTGGVDEYVAWTGNASLTHADFFTHPATQRWRAAAARRRPPAPLGGMPVCMLCMAPRAAPAGLLLQRRERRARGPALS